MRSGEVSSLGQARREFLRKESPWVIGAGIVALIVLRGVIGDLTWRDVVAVAALLAIYPFGEWAIHVYLLHAKPIKLRGREVETVAARAHRAHHGDPNDLDMVLLYWWQAAFLMLVAVPLTIGLVSLIVTLIAGPVPLGATGERSDRRLPHGLRLRVDSLPDPHRVPAADERLQGDLAQPPSPPLQERALLARDHQQPE